MKLLDMIAYSVKYLKTQRLRSWLTIIGIVIGIATIVSLVSIGDGIKTDIEKQMSEFGTNSIIIVPVNIEKEGMMFGGVGRRPTSGKLFEKDYDKVKTTPGIELVARVLYSRTSVEHKDKKVTAPVYATDSEIFDMWPDYLVVEQGRLFDDNERGVVVLGYSAANDMFGSHNIKVNNRIKIGGKTFRVVGVMKKIGTSLSQTDDSAIYIPYKDGRELFKSTLLDKEINIIMATVGEGYDVIGVKEAIQQKLLALHKVSEEDKDFSVITSDYIKNVVGQVLDTMSIFLLIISSVSAFVGGIGISNTMFMSVLNRTREVGVLKSIGAKKKDILALFVIEAIMLGLIGGVIGSAIGIAIVDLVNQYGIAAYVNPLFLIAVLIFSMMIGVVAGAIPAYNASNIPAIEALRY